MHQLLYAGVPGHTQELGAAPSNPRRQSSTLIRFLDGSMLVVNWDGRYEVSGMHSGEIVIIYCPYGRRLHIPWHRIDMIDHREREEDK
jgi:hypothetical protein